MAEALILDSEAVTALAYPKARAVLARRASAILRLAQEHRALVRVPAPVLAEVCRGSKHDAAINLLLSNPGVQVFDLTRALAQQAGHLLERLKLSSAHAVDAFVIATAFISGLSVSELREAWKSERSRQSSWPSSDGLRGTIAAEIGFGCVAALVAARPALPNLAVDPWRAHAIQSYGPATGPST